jgi:hypothetical protein
VLRPQDATDLYRNPRAEFRRMERTGVLRRVATGYYVAVPQERIGDPTWRPPIEDIAIGIAVADYGDAAALMGLSAARYHGAVPRAHAKAWIVTNVSRRPVDGGLFGLFVFVARDVGSLDLVRAHTEIATGWVTSLEQTAVDLLRRPSWADGRRAAEDAVARLLPRCRGDRLDELAAAQRGRSALARIRPDRAHQTSAARHVPASDDFSLELGRAVVRHLERDETAVRAVAQRNLTRARAEHDVQPPWVHRWQELLDGPTSELIAVLTSPNEGARVLRQSSPFAGVLTPRERWALLAEVKEARRAARSA